MRKLAVAVLLLTLLGIAPAMRAQLENPAAPYQQTGSGTGPSRNNGIGIYNLAYTLNGVYCAGFGTPTPCDPNWTFHISSMVYNGTITPGSSEVFFCQQVNYRASTFDEFDVCLHVVALRCNVSPAICTRAGFGWLEPYWAGTAELNLIEGSSNRTILWSVNLGKAHLNGQTIPFSGWLHMAGNTQVVFGPCQTYNIAVGYSSDNVTWNNYTSPLYSCAGEPAAGPTSGFLASAVPNATVTINLDQWLCGETQNNYVQSLTDIDFNHSGYFSGSWCDTEGGVLSCVSNGGTT